MRVTKQSHYNSQNKDQGSYVLAADNDLTNIFLALKGRIRLGDTNNGNSENIAGEYRVFSSVNPAEFSVKHTLGSVPIGWLVISKNGIGDLYKGTTAWTSDTAYFKCSAGSVSYVIFLLK